MYNTAAARIVSAKRLFAAAVFLAFYRGICHNKCRIAAEVSSLQLQINGLPIETAPGQSLLDAINALCLNSDNFPEKPIAAKISGELFSLQAKPDLIDSGTMKKALDASSGEVQLIYYNDPVGKDVYTRTAQFVLFLALHSLWPKSCCKMGCSVGNGLYVAVCNAPDFSFARLKEAVQQLVIQDIPLNRRKLKTNEAIEFFRSIGQLDKARLLSWRRAPHFFVYENNGFADYYYGELAPSTGYLQVWDILPAEGGFMFLFPDDNAPHTVASYVEMPNFQSVCAEGEKWCQLMECETVADLNGFVENGKIRELIRVNEALHEKRFSQVADMVCERKAKAVMLAGPSSSGKTTSANRLATQLRVHGKNPILLSLDDYYIDRERIPPGPDGKLDLEHINTIDTALFREHIQLLLQGSKISVPQFNFRTGKREDNGREICLSNDSVIVVEGLHALNPVLLPNDLEQNAIFKLYVSPLLPLNLDYHNRIPSSLLRLLRRIVRDYETRGATVQHTLAMWDSVRRGERKWIFPFQEQADVIFNSSTLYELSVLKKHIFPLLTDVGPEEACFEQVNSIVKVLNYVLEADVDDEIPPTSLVREFIGGNSFYRK